MTNVARRRIGFPCGQRGACVSLAGILGLLVALRRDARSATLDRIYADCVQVFRWLSALDATSFASPQAQGTRERLMAICEGLDELTATSLPTADDLQIRSAIEQLSQIAEFLSP